MPSLVGRESETDELQSVARMATDHAVLVLIDGPAGIGKTALVEYLREVAEGLGINWQSTAADPLESDRPFGPLIEVLGLWAQLAPTAHGSAEPSLPSSPFGLAADARYRTIDVITARVEAQCAVGPVAVVIEDLHFADASVLLTLRKLRQRLSSHPLLLVGTARPYAVEPESQRLLDVLRTEADWHLRPSPLNAVESTELARREIGGATLGPRLAEWLARADGSPLLVLALANALRLDGALQQDTDGVVELSADEALAARVPMAFSAQVRRRCELLGIAAREAVEAASVLGDTSELADIAQLVDTRPAQLMRSLREAATAGLIAAPSTEVRFAHDLVRSAVLDGIDPAQRSWLHQQAARLVAARNGSAAAVVSHLDASGAAPLEEVRRWVYRAATDALSRSPATAERLFGRAFEMTPEDDPERDTIAVARLGAATSAGLIDQAEVIGAALVGRSLPPELDVTTSWWLGGVLLLRNRAAEAAEVFEKAAGRLDGSVRAAQCLAMATMCYLTAMDSRMRPVAERAVVAAEASGDPLAITVAATAASRVVVGQLQLDRAHQLIARAVEVADLDISREAHRYQPHFMFAMLMLDRGDHHAALHHVALGLRRCQENGSVWAESLYHGQASVAHYLAGQLDEAVAEAAAGLAVADDVGVRMTVPWCLGVQALVHLHRGETDAAHAVVHSAQRELHTATGQVGVDLVALAEARLLLVEDGLEASLTHLTGAWDVLCSLDYPPMAFALASEMLRLAVVAGDNTLVGKVVDQIRAWQRGNALPWIGWVADVGDGLRGRGDAIAALPIEDGIVPLNVANLAVVVAQRLQGQQPAASARLLRAAERILDEHGASGDVEWSRRHFTGVTRRGRPTRRTKKGWDSLTSTERIVVEHLALGRSNKEICALLGIGRRTTETHVANVLHKLEVTSRLAVAAAVAQRVPQ